MVIRRALIEDRDIVVDALTRAFDQDPVANYLLRKDARRERAFRTFFDVAFRRLTLPLGETWIASGGEGAALWTPPNGWSTLRAWPNLFGLCRAVGFARVPHVVKVTNLVQREHPREPHWYLFVIGVVPEAVGRGVGSELLRAVLSRCDEQKEPAYLEASTMGGVRLYERHGFRVLKEVQLGSDGPPIWPMWRDAPNAGT
jgi:ribosomal protein S18 acetylase RimI-like enzyme